MTVALNQHHLLLSIILYEITGPCLRGLSTEGTSGSTQYSQAENQTTAWQQCPQISTQLTKTPYNTALTLLLCPHYSMQMATFSSYRILRVTILANLMIVEVKLILYVWLETGMVSLIWTCCRSDLRTTRNWVIQNKS